MPGFRTASRALLKPQDILETQWPVLGSLEDRDGLSPDLADRAEVSKNILDFAYLFLADDPVGFGQLGHQRTRQEARRAAISRRRAAAQGHGLARLRAVGHDTLQPRKEPKGRELRPYEKAINQVISRARIVAEHAIAGVKRCRIVADTFRGWRKGLVDEVMLAACGLHNLHESCRAT